MTAIGELTGVPIRKGSMSEQTAKALDGYDVSYETTPMGTILEVDEASELFAAARAAHEAVDEDRVITTLKVDDKRTSQRWAREKVTSVERTLGRDARRERK